MTRLLLGDEDFDHIAVGHLIGWGFDIVTIQDLGLADDRFPDELVLEQAIQLNRTLLTHNRRDFIRLHRKDKGHPGIIVCTQNTDHLRLAEKVADLLRSEEEFQGKLLRIYRD